jgi:hypothetical protein
MELGSVTLGGRFVPCPWPGGDSCPRLRFPGVSITSGSALAVGCDGGQVGWKWAPRNANAVFVYVVTRQPDPQLRHHTYRLHTYSNQMCDWTVIELGSELLGKPKEDAPKMEASPDRLLS